MNKIIKQAFTLIELLVVIAIIGILSGLIVVSMSGITQKAAIAKAQVFSNSLRNSLMLNTTGEWKLDGNADDSWSGGNNGTWFGSAGGTNTSANYRSSFECVSGTCLNFDGTDDYISIPYNSNLNVANLNAYTISAWVKTTTTSSMTVIGYSSLTDGDPVILFGEYSTGRALFQHRDNNGVISNLSSSSPSKRIDDGNWHFIVGTRLTANSFNLYVDTLLCGEGTDNVGTTNITEINIGFLERATPAYYWNGSIDEIRVYNTSMPTSQIQEQYYAGLNNLLMSGQITKEEYQNRAVGIK